MTDAPDRLGRFLPRYLRERQSRVAQLSPEDEAWTLSGALLFVDVVGFTSQVERLAAAGPQGVEQANDLVENSIGRLVEDLGHDGGDVVVFGGDALFVLWPALPGENDLSGAICRAASAALTALEDLAPAADSPQLRFSLGAGLFTAHRVGGIEGRWHSLLSGPAFEQVGRADALALNNALVASPEAWALAERGIQVSRAANGMLVVRGCRLAASASEQVREPPLRREIALPLLAEPVALSLSQLDTRWLSELRRPTVIFARLPGLLREGRLDGQRTHLATQLVQQAVAQYEGSTLQFVVDDKGPVFIVAFGLAARVHEDDPVRATLAALRMVDALSRHDIACGIGLATGRVFCGLIGGEQRSHYTLIGHTMNFAARLMQHASPGPLCDQLTRDLAQEKIDFVFEGTVEVKGLDRPFAHYRAAGLRSEPRDAGLATGAASPIFGREPELEILGSQLNALVSQRRGSVVALIGEAGIGKTRLVMEVARRGEASAVTALVAAGARSAGPQSRWGEALRRLVELGASDFPERGQDPYLRAFLGHEDVVLPDTDDAERALRTRAVICRLLIESARSRPVLLCVEDTHWMDSMSWALVARLAREAMTPDAGLMLILSTRELESSAPRDVLKRLSGLGMQQLKIGPLPNEDRARVAQAVIGAASLSGRATEWIASHSGGNPLFCRELAAEALDSGRLRLDNGRADFAAEHADAEALHRLPNTLQGLIASRLDRLEPGEQICLRVAAVIGVGFALASMLELHPDPEHVVRAQLDHLCEVGFLHPAMVEREPGYVFHHALMRDAAYDNLPYRRRRELHARLAAWLAQRHPGSQHAHVATLAHHWEMAEDWPRAFAARIRAGEVALANFANREATQHFQAARSLRGRGLVQREGAQAWAPELGLAQALHRMGDERASRRHLEEALRAYGELVPTRASGRLWLILRELAARVRPGPTGAPRHLRDPDRLRTVVRAYDLLPDIVYYDNDPLALVGVTLRFERLSGAEASISAERARALAWHALLLAGMGRRRASAQGFDQAIAAAEACGDAPVDAWTRLARGSLNAQLGEWPEAERWLRDALGRCEAMGDRTRGWNVMSALAHVLAYRGDLRGGVALLGEALRRNRDTDNPLFYAWGLTGQAGLLLRIGNPQEREEVIRQLGEAREALSLRPDTAADLFNRGLLAAALDRGGRHEEAFDLVRDTVEVALDRAPLVWLQVSSYLGLLEVLQGAGSEPSRQRDVLRLLRRIERSVRAFARLIPIGRPVLALIRARIQLLCQRPDAARKELRSGLAQAVALGLPLEIGELHLCLAEVSRSPQAQAELDHASAMFQRIGAQSRLQLALEQRLALRQAETA